MKTMALHTLLITTVANVTGFDQSSVESAAFAARLATEATIPADQVNKVLETIQGQMLKIDGDFAMQSRQHLEQAEAGVLAQRNTYKDMFADVGTETVIDNDADVSQIDPAIASAAQHQHMNGHDVSQSTT